MYSHSTMLKYLTLASVIATALCASAGVRGAARSEPSGGELSVLQKVYDDCQDKQDFTGCLKGKALTAMSRAIDMESIPLLDGIALVKQEKAENVTVPLLSDARALSGLSAVDRSLLDKVEQFLRTHVVRFDMRQPTEGARGNKQNKHHRYLIAAFLTAMGIAGPIGLKALAAIAGKALVISKVALTIAGILALKKIFAHDHHEETSFQVHASGHDNRRTAYVMRPSKVAAPASVDPYRYYYEQQQQQQQPQYAPQM
ncbi:uncharacterized protein LOC131281820 [Anopheles ziemanni]|uniref:uncharacterized protein LOC131261933 n=1 Tax=Anopheles coustani TaxID=139045 RepID=UPI00265A3F7A|nr:uncharacterized protein LOC131261933 [Anopheles coustani]XP_058167158.1 uncharacterized protein LOC131281820 [Anopheles ziemanni]